jgi:2-methylcitrate dehydratase PrpD
MIERIDLKVGAIVMELTGKTEPTTGLEGKFSVFHVASVSIIQGAAGEAQFSDKCVRDAEIVNLRRKVHAVIDPQLEWAQARVTITLKDGRVLDRLVLHPLGSLERPMSDKDLEEKFTALTEGILSAEQQKEAIKLCWSIETLKDAGAVPRALTIALNS